MNHSATYRDYEACYAISYRNFASGLHHYIHPDIPLPLMQVMRRAKLRYSMQCSAVLCCAVSQHTPQRR